MFSKTENMWENMENDAGGKWIYLDNEYEKYWRKLCAEENFALLRYGEAEKALMQERAAGTQEERNAGAGLTLAGQRLLDSLELRDQNVYYAIPCPCCNSSDYYWYLGMIKNENITFSNLWSNKNRRRFRKDIMSLARDAVVITEESNQDKNSRAEKIGNLNILKFYAIDNDSAEFWERSGESFVEKVIEETGELENVLFIVSSGPLSEIIIMKLFQNNPNNCYIDFGSAADFMFDNHTQSDMPEDSPHGGKNCWMFDHTKIKFDVSVVLTMYKRPEVLLRQLRAVKEQTLQPREIILYQDGIDSYYKIQLNDEIIKEFKKVQISENNQGVWKRFEFAKEVSSTTYTCIFDDDTIPGKKWLENCHMHMQHREGIYGANGIVVSDDLTYPMGCKDLRVGWVNPNRETVQVDFVGHSWFFATSWLKYMFDHTEKYRKKYKYVGEDMCFSYKCKEHGIPTYVPPHKYSQAQMWGSLPKSAKRFGRSQAAVSMNATNYMQMNQVLNDMHTDGWRFLCDTDKRYIEKLKSADIFCGSAKFESIGQDFMRNWKNGSKVFLYGAGEYGRLFYQYIKEHGKDIESFVVSERKAADCENYDNIPIIEISALDSIKGAKTVILALSEFYHEDVIKKLEQVSCVEIFPKEDCNYTYKELIEAVKVSTREET